MYSPQVRKCRFFFQLTLLRLAFRSYPIWPVHGRMPCASLGQVDGPAWDTSWVAGWLFPIGGLGSGHPPPPNCPRSIQGWGIKKNLPQMKMYEKKLDQSTTTLHSFKYVLFSKPLKWGSWTHFGYVWKGLVGSTNACFFPGISPDEIIMEPGFLLRQPSCSLRI